MIKKNKLLFGLIIIWIIAIIIWIIYPRNKSDIDSNTFTKNVSISQNEDKVGAKVILKEAIHGTKGIMYRYIVKTDCPKWNFESRYMTENPLTWVDGKTSAVEVLIYDIQIRYNGTIYANDTYYVAPLLNNLASENISLEEWKQNLIKQAYQTYVSKPKKDLYLDFLIAFISIMTLLIGGKFIIKIFDMLDAKGIKASEISADKKND